MELIKIQNDQKDDPVISGRELHEFLDIGTRYDIWFGRMLEYGFIENQDFTLVVQKRATNNPKNPWTTITDHAMKLDMAKEICMIQRSDKGRQARQYFIECEKELQEKKLFGGRSKLDILLEVARLAGKGPNKDRVLGEIMNMLGTNYTFQLEKQEHEYDNEIIKSIVDAVLSNESAVIKHTPFGIAVDKNMLYSEAAKHGITNIEILKAMDEAGIIGRHDYGNRRTPRVSANGKQIRVVIIKPEEE